MKEYPATGSMPRAEFRRLYIAPLEEHFGIKAYFNGEAPKDKKTGSSTLGCFRPREDVPLILLRYRRCSLELLGILIHEYAHSQLHANSYQRIPDEAEAELVRRESLHALGLPVAPWTRSFSRYCRYAETRRSRKAEVREIRLERIERLTDEIVEALQPSVEQSRHLLHFCSEQSKCTCFWIPPYWEKWYFLPGGVFEESSGRAAITGEFAEYYQLHVAMNSLDVVKETQLISALLASHHKWIERALQLMHCSLLSEPYDERDYFSRWSTKAMVDLNELTRRCLYLSRQMRMLSDSQSSVSILNSVRESMEIILLEKADVEAMLLQVMNPSRAGQRALRQEFVDKRLRASHRIFSRLEKLIGLMSNEGLEFPGHSADGLIVASQGRAL
ncbi:MAG: hypothetical protein LBI64_03865 [Coriobacteriales bacterium]|jgi:hypothetical protein|nr:hypothetical protein [Coriobacteriales bacterium]